MKTGKYFLRIVGILFIILLIIFSIVALIVWSTLSMHEKNTLLNMLIAHSNIFILLLLTIIPLMLTLFSIFFQYYIIPLYILAEEISLIYSVNPCHRIAKIKGSKIIKELTEIINQGSRRYEELKNNVAKQVEQAKLTLENDKNILTSIIEELSEGIVICNQKGKITFYNKQAKNLLSGSKGKFIGLDRSIYELLDENLINYAIEEIKKKLKQINASSYFVASGKINNPVSVEVVPILNCQKMFTGFILILNDIFPHPEIENRIQAFQRKPAISSVIPHKSSDFNLFKKNNGLLSNLTYTVFDTETTGLFIYEDEIVSIGAIRIVNQRLLYEEFFDTLVDPKRQIPIRSTRVHGIHPEMVIGKPSINKALPIFYKFAEDTVLVGHNVAFDMSMLNKNEKNSGIKFSNPVLDTLLLSEVVHPYHQDHQIEKICKRLGVKVEKRHTAMGDAITTGRIFLKLIPLLAEKGIYTLKDAEEASKNTYYGKLKY